MENYFCANSVEEQVDYLTDKVKDIITNKLDKASIVQETGTGTDVVMSQKAVTDAIAGKGLDTLTDVNLTVGNTTVQYDTTNGIQLNSTARFTDVAGNHDATMNLDLPVVGKDGIVIDKAADSEKIEVSGKNFRKLVTGSANEIKVYVTKYGDKESWMFLNTDPDGAPGAEIPQYGYGGTLRANMPATPLDNSVVNKEYADNNYAKALKTEVGQYKVYASRNGNPNDFLWTGTEVLADLAIVIRGNNGCIYTNMPDAANTKDTTVPNKKYVDDAIASISPTTQTKYQHNLVLEGTKLGSTIKAFMSIPRSDDTPFGTLDEIIAALGDAYIPCTGYIYDGNQKSFAIVAFNTAGPGFECNNPESGGEVFMIANDDVTVTDNVLQF